GMGWVRAVVSSGRGLPPCFCERPQFGFRLATVKPEDAALWGAGHGPIRFPRDPACVHVDCAGPVREDVPSHGLLSEGLTGENDRLKRGLKSRTPAIPLHGLGSRGGKQVASLGAISRLVLLGEAPHGVTRRAIRAGVPTLADYLGAFCP